MVTHEPNPSDPTGAAGGPDYLIRSEERLDVRTEQVLGGWVRLEKYLVTETRTVTVELTHEEVRLVRQPVDRPDPTPAASDGQNDARWMYVNREELVVTKRVVPVERVRLEVFAVTELQQITEAVGKEQITGDPRTSVDPPGGAGRPHDHR